MTPVARLPVAVHHGNDEQEIRFNAVKHGIGKNVREAAPDVVLKDFSPLRIFFDAVEQVSMAAMKRSSRFS